MSIIVDLQRYKIDVERTAEERKEIQQEHLERIKQGKEVWNAWADAVEVELKKIDLELSNPARRIFEIDFSDIEFKEETSFYDFTFPISVSFHQARFLLKTDFRDVVFESNVNFGDVTFKSHVLFDDSTFKLQANFSNVVFESIVTFWNSIFVYETMFTNTKFQSSAIFITVTFSNTEFHGAFFGKRAYFQKSTFNDVIIFENVTFKSKADLSNTIFKSKAFFIDATFEAELDFESAEFLAENSFNGTSFHSNVFFENVFFGNSSDFSKSKFISTKPQKINFSGVRFENSVLLNDMGFEHNSILPVDFRQTHFNNIPLMESLPSDVVNLQKKVKQFGVTDFSKYESQFRTLKRLAEANNNHQKALEFYACELYCQRRATKGLKNIKNWAGFLYGLSSNYGLSLLRPFCFWLAIMCGGAIGQAWVDNKITFTQPYSFNAERAAFYAAPSLPPFIQNAHYQKEVRQRLYPANNNNNVEEKGKLPMPIRIIRGVQTFFTFIAIFLFGLALRNRFKIK